MAPLPGKLSNHIHQYLHENDDLGGFTFYSIVYANKAISINKNSIKNIVMIFRIDLTGSLSLMPSIRNNIPLSTRPRSAIQINFAAPGQCITLNRKPSNTTITVSEEKIRLNFSNPEVGFPTK